MKKSTKIAIAKMLESNLLNAKAKRGAIRLSQKDAAQRINTHKKSIAQLNQMLEVSIKFGQSKKTVLNSKIIEKIRTSILDSYRQIRTDRQALTQMYDSHYATTIEVRQTNDLLNDFSPYKKSKTVSK